MVFQIAIYNMSIVLKSEYVKKVPKENNVRIAKVNCNRETLNSKSLHNCYAVISNDYRKTSKFTDEFWVREYNC